MCVAQLWVHMHHFAAQDLSAACNRVFVFRKERREMVRVYPQLRDTHIDYVWGGTLDFAFDMMTHVGEVDGVYYSLGYAGHGVAMASHLGKTVAEAMLAGNIKEHPFAKFDFPGAPLGMYNGFPWFLPFAGAWQKMLDWIE